MPAPSPELKVIQLFGEGEGKQSCLSAPGRLAQQGAEDRSKIRWSPRKFSGTLWRAGTSSAIASSLCRSRHERGRVFRPLAFLKENGAGGAFCLDKAATTSRP